MVVQAEIEGTPTRNTTTPVLVPHHGRADGERNLGSLLDSAVVLSETERSRGTMLSETEPA